MLRFKRGGVNERNIVFNFKFLYRNKVFNRNNILKTNIYGAVKQVCMFAASVDNFEVIHEIMNERVF